jgi:tRNA (guanine37-N1)-methyltransferase
MKIEILTIFPEIFSGFTSSSLIGKAQERGLLSIQVTDIRDFASAPHFSVDDSPYGGGAGMLMRPEPLYAAIAAAKLKLPDAKVLLLTPTGARFNQKKAQSVSKLSELILVCGRYEGVDQRVIDLCIDEQISIGDYVLMGGEVPAMVLIEASTRLLPEVLGNTESTAHESFTEPLLEAPQYTRPPEFMGQKVPEVLLSGNHKRIQEWRQAESKKRTLTVRPDLLEHKNNV